jgi:hypothetical protein
MNMAVRGSLGSRTDPRNCCDSGGNESERGLEPRTCEFMFKSMGVKGRDAGVSVSVCR